MSQRCDVLVVGGGPVGACAAQALAADGASVTLIEKEAEVCPPVSGAHHNCGLLVPSDVAPLAAPGALGQGLRWLLDEGVARLDAPEAHLVAEVLRDVLRAVVHAQAEPAACVRGDAAEVREQPRRDGLQGGEAVAALADMAADDLARS